jgi:anti-anti-sigma factor
VVVVDLIGVTLIDSSGIRCLATLQSESGPGRGLELVAARRHVQRVLELAGVADMFTYRTNQ